MSKETKHNEIVKMNKEQLIEQGRKDRILMNNRLKRLEKNIKDKPGEYSPFGYNEMVKDGIPMISTKMEVNELKANVSKLNHLKRLETTTSRGAKRVQQSQVRKIINVKPEGRLNVKDRKKYDEALKYNQQNPKAMSVHWQAFDQFKRDMQHLGLDSEQLLELYRPVHEQGKKDGYTEMEDMFNLVSEYSEEYHNENEKREDMADKLEAESGWEI